MHLLDKLRYTEFALAELELLKGHYAAAASRHDVWEKEVAFAERYSKTINELQKVLGEVKENPILSMWLSNALIRLEESYVEYLEMSDDKSLPLFRKHLQGHIELRARIKIAHQKALGLLPDSPSGFASPTLPAEHGRSDVGKVSVLAVAAICSLALLAAILIPMLITRHVLPIAQRSLNHLPHF